MADKDQALEIDNGSVVCQAGFACDDAACTGQKDSYVGNEAQSKGSWINILNGILITNGLWMMMTEKKKARMKAWLNGIWKVMIKKKR